MTKSKKNKASPEAQIEHDTWPCTPPKIRSAGKIEVGPIHGVLPFTGVRNPITTSSVSHKIMLDYRTAANGWQRKVGAAESGAEAAVAEEALISENTYDVEFQPLTVEYEYPPGHVRKHTIDLRVTLRCGLRRLVFVRNRESLEKPYVQAEIDAIHAAIPPHHGDRFCIVEADSYSRARRDNLRRMHRKIAFEPDPDADEIVEEAVRQLKTLWRMSDICPIVDLAKARVFQSCLRLIARKRLGADMDAVICHQSRIWRVQ